MFQSSDYSNIVKILSLNVFHAVFFTSCGVIIFN